MRTLIRILCFLKWFLLLVLVDKVGAEIRHVTCKEYKHCSPAECPPRPGGYPPTYRTEVIFDYALRPPISCNGVELPRVPEIQEPLEAPASTPKSPIWPQKQVLASAHTEIVKPKAVKNNTPPIHVHADNVEKHISSSPLSGNQTGIHRNESSTPRQESIAPVSDHAKHTSGTSGSSVLSTYILGCAFLFMLFLL